MVDYYSVVSKATNALGAHTEEARRRVYDRARAAFVSEVHKLAPALDRSEIMAEQFYLELAIGEVEADTQREQSARYRQDFRQSRSGSLPKLRGSFCK